MGSRLTSAAVAFRAVLPVLLLFLLTTAMAGTSNNAPTQQQIVSELKAGNARFAAGTPEFPRQNPARISASKSGQHPIATVLSCSDSRVPVEKVFDQGIGDLFVVRVNGNDCGTHEATSIEHGVRQLSTPVVVVLGHTQCSAQNGAPAFATTSEAGRSASQVWESIENLMRRSSLVREKVIDGSLKVYGGVYHVENGEVEWLGQHPKQKSLLADPSTASAPSTAPESISKTDVKCDISKVHAPDGITSAQAIDWLKDGNIRFMAQKPMHPNQDPSYRASQATAQRPFATVVACSDSRLPLENLLDVGVGDILVVRSAGELVNANVISSIEDGIVKVGTPLLMVIGHTSCDAHASSKAEVLASVEQLYAASPSVGALVKAGKLSVQGALYDLESGSISWFGNHPEQAALMEGTTISKQAAAKPAPRFAEVPTTVARTDMSTSTAVSPAAETPVSADAAVSADKLDAALKTLEETVTAMTGPAATPPATVAPAGAVKPVAKSISDANLASIIADIEYLKSEIIKLKGQTADAAKMLASLEDVTAAPAGSEPQVNKLASLVTTLNKAIEQQKASTKPPVNATTAGHGAIQFTGYVHQQYYSKFGTAKSSTFDSKRVRIGIAGDVNSYARLDFVGEFAKSPKLLDAALSLSPNKSWTFKVGQCKVPFSADLLRSGTGWPFVNLSLASSLGPDRDIGMAVRYGTKLSKSSSIDFYTGVYNGAGINTSDANSNKNLAVRAVAKLGTQLTVSPNWYVGKSNDTGSIKQNLSTYGGSVAWSLKRDVVEMEYVGSKVGTTRKEGWYVFGGHTVPTTSKFLQELQFVARYEQFDANVKNSGDKTSRITIGTNLFIDKKYTLIQLDYQINGEQGTSVSNNEFLLNFQVAF